MKTGQAWRTIVLVVLASVTSGCLAPTTPQPGPARVSASSTPLAAVSTAPRAVPAVAPSPAPTRQSGARTVATGSLPQPTARPARPENTAEASPAITVTAPTSPPAAAAATATAPAGQTSLYLTGPLIVDGPRGRIYTPARLGGPDGPARTAVLAAAGGRALAVYDTAGLLALDGDHDRLYVDQGDAGLAILEASTGKTLRTVALPPPGSTLAAPQAHPAGGQVMAMRGPDVLFIDGATGQILDKAGFDLRPQDNCRAPHDTVLPINGTLYDAVKRILYLDFVTYACTPYIGVTIVDYDLNSRSELGRQGASSYEAAAGNGALYLFSWYRMGAGTLTAWRAGKSYADSTDWSGWPSSLQLDEQQGRLYQGIDQDFSDPAAPRLPGATGNSLRVFDTASMRLLREVALPKAGALAGVDPASDQLYFLADGQLWQLSATALLQSPVPPEPPAGPPPAQPVGQVLASPAWSQDHSLFAAWTAPMPLMGKCYVFGQSGGPAGISRNAGEDFQIARSGLPPDCPYASALAISPAFSSDRTLWTGIVGTGLFTSRDGGGLWQPLGRGLPTVAITQLAPSPAFAADRTIFAVLKDTGLARSLDGGETWQTPGIKAVQIALSPEFGQDHTLVSLVRQPEGTTGLQISRDGGERWAALPVPGPEPLLAISLAPLFSRWGVMFAYSNVGTLYRSADAGQSWQNVLAADMPNAAGGQFAYGSDENQRPVFFLGKGPDNLPAGGTPVDGRLFRSQDGGLTWVEVSLPDAQVPTAIAISPAFAADGLIFVGMANGSIRTAPGLSLPTRPH